MIDKIKVFISYKKDADHHTPAFVRAIAAALMAAGLDVFLDDLEYDAPSGSGIQWGARWADTIYTEIRSADVFLLLLQAAAASSEWVQREVDVARGAQVSILPLLIDDLDEAGISAAQDKLALSEIQRSKPFRGVDKDDRDYVMLLSHIRRLALETQDQQKGHYRERENHWYALPRKDFDLGYRTYRLPGPRFNRLRICLAVGNVLDAPSGSIDVIVNSENDFLHMARFFEVSTLSARLRRAGSYIEEGGIVVDDTVQRELDEYVADHGGRRPLPTRSVVVRSAGHEKGVLRARKKVKYLFHAVTVRLNIGSLDHPVHPLDNQEEFRDTISRIFEKINELNSAHEAAGTAPLRSVAIPIFGTGSGGNSVSAAARKMVSGLYDALRELDSISFDCVYLLVYSDGEVQPVEKQMDSLFEPA